MGKTLKRNKTVKKAINNKSATGQEAQDAPANASLGL